MHAAVDHVLKISDGGTGLGADDEALLIPLGQEEAAHLLVVNNGGKVKLLFVHGSRPIGQRKFAVTGAAAVAVHVLVAVIGAVARVVGIKRGEICRGQRGNCH